MHTDLKIKASYEVNKALKGKEILKVIQVLRETGESPQVVPTREVPPPGFRWHAARCPAGMLLRSVWAGEGHGPLVIFSLRFILCL